MAKNVTTRRLKVAAVQVTSIDGAPERNLANAARHVEAAASSGAELVLCPEFLAPGYVYEESIWSSAEPRGGLTESWLSALGRKHGIVIGATFLEAEGDDFYNTFSLFGPRGELLGRVRKQSLPFFEGWFFSPCPLPKVIDSPMGRIGVGICNDNQTAELLRHLAAERPDLLLMPHSAPSPLGIATTILRVVMESQLQSTPPRWARALGVPVVMANKVSTAIAHTRIPIATFLRVPIRFRGFSSICASDGAVVARLVDREGVVLADVNLDPERKRDCSAPRRGYWSFPPAVLARSGGVLLRVLDALGRRAYRNNPRRVAAARACTPTQPGERVVDARTT